jgi:hypothetical protein
MPNYLEDTLKFLESGKKKVLLNKRKNNNIVVKPLNKNAIKQIEEKCNDIYEKHECKSIYSEQCNAVKITTKQFKKANWL